MLYGGALPRASTHGMNSRNSQEHKQNAKSIQRSGTNYTQPLGGCIQQMFSSNSGMAIE